MKLSVDWLREWVDPRVSDEELAERFTSVGLVVDDVRGPHESLRHVVAGRIESVESHPNADRLTLCRVYDGRETVAVVCGAPNARAGMIVPFAPVGTTLPNGLTLKKAKIRGEVSNGMLCSAAELGVSEDASGLLDLGDDVEPGRSLLEVLDGGGVTLDIDVPYNRPDWLSVRGVAREASAMFGVSVAHPESEPEEGRDRTDAAVRVRIADPADCPIYGARVVRGVQIGPSPDWLRRRLESVGQRSINNVVDATNYVLFAYGQPIHAFDLDRVEGGDITVRRAEKGETLVTLDDVTRALTEAFVVIADPSGPIALAGVMGGASTEVHEGTTSLLIESACFATEPVRQASRLLGLVSEASTRFARGVDAMGVLTALDATARLIQRVAGGTVCSGAVVAGQAQETRPTVTLRHERLTQLLGKAIPEPEVMGVLDRLGFEPSTSDDIVRCTVPSWRHDVTREVDLIEEVARYHGYDAFPERRYNGGGVSAAPHATNAAIQRSLGVWMGLGFQEVCTSAFQRRSEAEATAAWSHLGRPPVLLRNAKSADADALRTSLLPGHLRVSRHNLHTGTLTFRLIEHDKIHGIDADGRPTERWEAAGVIVGPLASGSWRHEAVPFDFFALKGFLERWAEHLGLPVSLTEERPGAPFHAEESASFEVGDVRAKGGRIDPAVAASADVPPDLFLFSIDFETVIAVDRAVARFEAPSKYPAVKRDLAFVVDEGVAHADVERAILAAGGDWIQRAHVFDQYRGKPIPAGRKSLAYALTFQARERSLTNAEVDGAIQSVVERLTATFAAELRDA